MKEKSAIDELRGMKFEKKDIIAGKYFGLETIGMGASAMVVKAWDTILQKYVCLKIGAKPQEGEKKEDLFHRFEKESLILSSLNHQNIVQCYDFTAKVPEGETIAEKQSPVLVLQYIDGIDLWVYRSEYDISYPRIVNIAVQIASALDHAHNVEPRVIHRDIKASNILINEQGHISLVDFGISKLGKSLQTTIHRIGTNGFIAPEIIQQFVTQDGETTSKEIDARVDLYSLGCVLYFLVTGELPYGNHKDEYFPKVIDDLKGKKYVPIIEYREDCPDSIIEMIEKLMSFSREDRHESAADLLDHLYGIVREIGPPETRLLDFEEHKARTPMDVLGQASKYNKYVNQSHGKRMSLLSKLERQQTEKKEPTQDAFPPKFSKKFKTWLGGCMALLVILMIANFQTGKRGSPVQETTKKQPTEAVTLMDKHTISPQEIKKELEKTPLKAITPDVKEYKQVSKPSKSKKRNTYRPIPKKTYKSYGDTLLVGGNSDSSFSNRKLGVVESSKYSAILMSKIVTTDLSAPVVAKLNQDIIVDGKVIIPEGSKIIGRPRGTSTERVPVRFHKFIVKGSNKEISFSGIAFDGEGAPGIVGKIDREKSKKVARGGGDVFTGAGGIIIDNVTGNSIGGRILNDAGDEVVDQVDEEIQYSTKNQVAVEVGQGAYFMLYISKSF